MANLTFQECLKYTGIELDGEMERFYREFCENPDEQPVVDREYLNDLAIRFELPDEIRDRMHEALDEIEADETLHWFTKFLVRDMCAARHRCDLDDYRAMTPSCMKHADLYSFLLLIACVPRSVKRLEEQGYMAANHILFLINDKATGETLDEATAAEKKAKADEVYAELSAITDVEELLARFKELKEEYDEDTGKVSYPDGYTFTSGTMVSEFEDAVLAMEDHQISEPVKSTYGWHIIMRTPLGSDSLLRDSSGSFVPAGWVYAQQKLGEELESYMDTSLIEYAEGFKTPDLLNYIK